MLNSKLFSNLSKVRNNAIGSIETCQTIQLTGGKKNPMQGRVTKKTSGGSVQFFGNTKSNGYLNMKRRKAAKNGDADAANIKPKKRVWGERIKETPLIFHKGKVYVELVYLHAPKNVEYFLDGKPIDKASIKGLPKSRKSNPGEVVLRVLKLETITRLKMGKLSA